MKFRTKTKFIEAYPGQKLWDSARNIVIDGKLIPQIVPSADMPVWLTDAIEKARIYFRTSDGALICVPHVMSSDVQATWGNDSWVTCDGDTLGLVSAAEFEAKYEPAPAEPETKQADGGWIEWHWQENAVLPVAGDVRVEVRLRNGAEGLGPAEAFDWVRRDIENDIVAYRVAPPMIISGEISEDVKEAFRASRSEDGPGPTLYNEPKQAPDSQGYAIIRAYDMWELRGGLKGGVPRYAAILELYESLKAAADGSGAKL